ncbi:MAG: hypothetical protein E7329_12270 [Clostridiales bacterium]|nr:hypothetical protein [Clostridiales bacterium]
MLNEKKIRDGLDRHLAPLSASPDRRMRIRAAIAAEKQENTPMKRKWTATLVFALIAVMLTASIAIAEHFNLFSFFGTHDERYAAIAPEATLSITEPARLEHPYLGSVRAAIDSAYYDGLTLNLAYRIENSRHVEAYTPTSAEIASMQKTDAWPIGLAGNEPGIDIYEKYNVALENGTPFGYRQYSVYLSDHTVTDDGIDIPPYATWEDYDENGDYCELREFEMPLPDALKNRDTLRIAIALHQQETRIWFDGKDCYISYSSDQVGKTEATIPRTKDGVQIMLGRGAIGTAACTAKAEISKLAAVVTFSCDKPLNAFLAAPPEGTAATDTWVEFALYDENGTAYRLHGSFSPDERTEATLAFLGTGELPEKLKLYIYTAWEGAEEPNMDDMEYIELAISKNQ